jgi:Tfp pilus assembly PilM family ATPase
MIATATTLPLGVDLGRQRVRVALTVRSASGATSLVAVGARDVGPDPAAALRDAVHELGTTERRCVVGIAFPDAHVRVVTMPAMGRFERRRAAAFAAARYIDYPVAEATVTLVPLDGSQRFALGIARTQALEARLTTVRKARLKPLAVDDIALAQQRVLVGAQASIDITEDRTRLTIFADPVPFVAETAIGGAALTEGIARSLGIDARAAEVRKRSVGFAGAGEAQRDALTSGINDLLAAGRAAGYGDIVRAVLIGNGSRVPGLAEAIGRVTGLDVRPAALDPSISETVPADVLRAATADWTVAYGLSLWECAA